MNKPKIIPTEKLLQMTQSEFQKIKGCGVSNCDSKNITDKSGYPKVVWLNWAIRELDKFSYGCVSRGHARFCYVESSEYGVKKYKELFEVVKGL